MTTPTKAQITITVWKDGTWKIWSSFDAHLTASADENWLVNIPECGHDGEQQSISITHSLAETIRRNGWNNAIERCKQVVKSFKGKKFNGVRAIIVALDKLKDETCAQERNDTEHLLKSPANAEAILESVEQADRGELQEIKDKS